MQNIYDNGRLCLGEVGKIRQQLIDNAINYDSGMGCSIEYWTTKDIITRKEV